MILAQPESYKGSNEMPEDTDQPQPTNAPDNVAGESAPDSDAPPEQPAQPMFPQVNVQLAPDGLHIFVVPAPVNVAVGEEGMDAICTQWLESRPALFAALLEKHIKRMQAANQGLQIVKDPKAIKRIAKSKNRMQA